MDRDESKGERKKQQPKPTCFELTGIVLNTITVFSLCVWCCLFFSLSLFSPLSILCASVWWVLLLLFQRQQQH
eukprot:m.264380 g.264380  ORF g.264380 m.264380 type:complete len:73 (-) comp27775_c0_seq1:232-450(-)